MTPFTLIWIEHSAHTLVLVVQVVSSLLDRALVTFRILASFQPFLDVGPLLTIRAQLFANDESRREMHRDVSCSWVFANEERALRKRKLAL